MGKKTKIGITEWSLPVDGPYGSKIAAEIGFEGVQLDVGSYERNFPKNAHRLSEVQKPVHHRQCLVKCNGSR